MLVSWDDGLTLGHDIIDNGHRLVIEAINCLNQAVAAEECRTMVERWLPLLEDHLARQFEHEGALLLMTRAPGRDGHEAEHRNFMAVLGVLKADHTRGEDVSAVLLLNLVCFLTAHLRVTDHDTFAPPHTRAA